MPSCSERFFGSKWSSMVYWMRWYIIIIFASWVAYAVYKGKDIGPVTEEINFLPDEHYMMKNLGILRNQFGSGQVN